MNRAHHRDHRPLTIALVHSDPEIRNTLRVIAGIVISAIAVFCLVGR